MLDVEELRSLVCAFKKRHGIQDEDEHVIAAIHLINRHKLQPSLAQDQTSHGAGDNGIDGWYYDQGLGSLYVYQSKLSSVKSTVAQGFGDLQRAGTWISGVLESGEVGSGPTAPVLYNLAGCLDREREKLTSIHFRLISPFQRNELLGQADYDETCENLSRSALNQWICTRGGQLHVEPERYYLDGGLPPPDTYYETTGCPASVVRVGKYTELEIVYLHLASLVDLYRRRGNRLFEKNLRLYLTTKDARARLEHPLEETLKRICVGELEPTIFPFYHVGVTITASARHKIPDRGFAFESPNVINGCQTINIADRYLRSLEREKAADKIARFREIPVLAKVVIGADNETVREVAISNNRQNPIESWQLFANDQIHIEIEDALRAIGVFYERQKGRFEADKKFARFANDYPNTHGTRITVQDLGQLIALCRREIRLAAKPSDIYASKKDHDAVFDRTVPNHARDSVWAFNAFRAAKAALNNYLRLPVHDNEITHGIFRKPLVRNMLLHLAIMYLYQRREEFLAAYAVRLNKIAPQKLGEQAIGFYRSVVTKTKVWYSEESERLTVDVPWRRISVLLSELCTDTGLEPDGLMPFTSNSIDWSDLNVGGCTFEQDEC